MSSYSVRPATDADATAVATIHAESSHAAYEGLVAAGQPLPADKRLAFWRDAIEYGEPLIHVATDESGKVIGFVGFDRSRDPKSRPTTGEIWALYVQSSHWKKGVGLALWDAAREGLIEEGCTEVTLWVPLCNERALRFIELAGFKRELSSAKTALVGGTKLEEIRLRRPLA